MVSVMLSPCMFCGTLSIYYFVVECDGVVKCGWWCSIG